MEPVDSRPDLPAKDAKQREQEQVVQPEELFTRQVNGNHS
jgi:hypothetical protein